MVAFYKMAAVCLVIIFFLFIICFTTSLESGDGARAVMDQRNDIIQYSSEEEMSVLVDKIVENFPGCEMVHVLDSPNFKKLEEHDFYHRMLGFSKIHEISAGTREISFGENITFSRHNDIHRFAKNHCSLGLLVFHSFNLEYEEWLEETVIPRYAPILRKDRDHFIFIASNQKLSDEILLSPQFGSKVKFKLAIHYQEHIVCKTVDFYGNKGHEQLKILRTFHSESVAEVSLQKLDLFPDMTTHFNGKTFRFAIPKVAFRFEIEMGSDGRYHPKRGFYKWWLDEAMDKFNFTYDIFWASFGGGTGKLLKNGTWVGATGDIFYGRADCSFIVGEIYSRHRYLGWSSSISYEWVIFVTHMPRISYSPRAIFWSFTRFMWGLILVSMMIVTFSFKIIARAHARINRSDKNISYLKMIGYIFSTLMEQDVLEPLKYDSVRVLCAFWLLFSIVISTGYRGKLVSLIAFPIKTWVPSTFEELANSKFKVALNVVGKAGAAYAMIATSSNPVFQTLASRMELIPEPETCLQRAMTEELGCIVWKGISDYAVQKNLSDKSGYAPLHESSQIALFIGDGLVYERRAIFGLHLDRTIQAAVQMGLTIKWFFLDQEFIRRERKSLENATNIVYEVDNGGPKKLIVSQFTGLFFLGLIGVILSVTQFFVEYFGKKRGTGIGPVIKIDVNDLNGTPKFLEPVSSSIYPANKTIFVRVFKMVSTVSTFRRNVFSTGNDNKI